jgi:hypothetical protein
MKSVGSDSVAFRLLGHLLNRDENDDVLFSSYPTIAGARGYFIGITTAGPDYMSPMTASNLGVVIVPFMMRLIAEQGTRTRRIGSAQPQVAPLLDHLECGSPAPGLGLLSSSSGKQIQ